MCAFQKSFYIHFVLEIASLWFLTSLKTIVIKIHIKPLCTTPCISPAHSQYHTFTFSSCIHSFYSQSSHFSKPSRPHNHLLRGKRPSQNTSKERKISISNHHQINFTFILLFSTTINENKRTGHTYITACSPLLLNIRPQSALARSGILDVPDVAIFCDLEVTVLANRDAECP